MKKMSKDRQSTRTDDSTYNAQYPYNQVTETPAGHQWQVDNTPGHERVFFRHSSGTYTEISSDGKVVNFSVGDSKTYGKAGWSMTIDVNGDVKMTGHSRFVVGGGAHIEVAGEAGVFAGGDMAAAVMGKANIRASQVYIGTDGDTNLNVGGNMNIEVKSDMNVKAGGNINMNGATINLNS